MRIHSGRVLAAFALAAGLGSASPTVADGPLSHIDPGAKAPDFAAPGADGRVHHLSDYAGKMVVLEWTSPVCPYTALKYRDGAMQALQKRAAGQGVVWIAIDTSAPGRPGYLTPAAMQARMAGKGMHVTAFLSDASGRIGREYGAKTTPELYVIGRDGRLAYEGAIDDNPASTRPGSPTYVAPAIDAVRAGKPAPTPQTLPYGCAVEY
jgi:AhpC/TSA family